VSWTPQSLYNRLTSPVNQLHSHAPQPTYFTPTARATAQAGCDVTDDVMTIDEGQGQGQGQDEEGQEMPELRSRDQQQTSTLSSRRHLLNIHGSINNTLCQSAEQSYICLSLTSVVGPLLHVFNMSWCVLYLVSVSR